MPKSNKFSNIRYITIIVLLSALSYGLIRSTLDVYKGGRRVVDLEDEVSSLEKKKEELERSIEYKKTDEFIEEKARNDLNLIKPGESVFVVSGPGNEGFLEKKVLSTTDRRVGVTSGIKDTNWYKWYKLFF